MRPTFMLLNVCEGETYEKIMPLWVNIGNILYMDGTYDGGSALHMIGGELIIVMESIEDILWKMSDHAD